MEEKITLKTIVSMTVGAGISQVIDDAIDATAPAEMKLPVKILRKIGSIALGWFIADWAMSKAAETYDQIETSVMQIQEKVNEAAAEVETENDISESEVEG